MAAVLVLVLLAGVLLAWQRPWQSGDAATDQAVVALPADAASRLTAQFRALSEADSQDAFVAAAGDLAAGREFGLRTWRSLQALAAPGASFRYISGGEVADRADGSATAVAEVEWRPSASSGLDESSTHRSSVELRVAPEQDGTFSIVSAARRVGNVPIWLVGAVAVDRGDGRTVIRIDGGDDALPVDDLATRARAAVGAVVPVTGSTLAIVSPSNQEQMATILGQDTGAVAQIAAVTTRLDGESDGQDVVVVLNPAVFDTMDRRAAQVVVSHEATHALTSAVGTPAPDWVVEGFADYVALRDDTAALSVSAGQILATVKAGRLPDQLPDDSDFGATEYGLGGVYESAWMIFRLLGERFSDDQILSFYESVIDGRSIDRALDESFGLTLEELTTQWRDYLTKSASTVS